MNLGATLKAAEKVFGPALPGRGTEENTLSAVRYAKGGATKYAGIVGFDEGAKFYLHFPTPVDWNLLTTKKGTPDFISDLRESGPQGEQGREILVARFFEKQGEVREKARLKQEKAATAAAKKEAAATKAKEKTEKDAEKAQKKAEAQAQKTEKKREVEELRLRLAAFVGERHITLNLEGESVTVPVKITVDKSGKIKITAVI